MENNFIYEAKKYRIDELATKLNEWLLKENIRRASLHELWSDFPLRRHLLTSNKWARVLNTGERMGFWKVEEGREKGSKIVVKGKPIKFKKD